MTKSLGKVTTLLALWTFLHSCAHRPSFQLEKTYRKDLRFIDSSGTHEGISIADIKDRHQFRLLFREKPRLVKIRSCHREIVYENPGKTLDFSYSPEAGLEDEIEPCFLEFASFTKEGYNQTALVDFRRDESLEATLTCNGERTTNQGVSICQTREGLLQRLEFSEPVSADGLASCPKLTGKSLTFIFPVSIGICLYYFYDGTSFHKLVTFGYDDVLEVIGD